MERYNGYTKDHTQHLTSNKDLCEFYRVKVHRLEEKFTKLWDVIENLTSNNREITEVYTRLKVVTDELTQEQMAISDLQVFLFREREDNLRLAAENDKLKIRTYTNNRAIDLLLKISGVSAERLSEMLSNSTSPSELKSSRSSVSGTRTCLRDQSKETLLLRIKSLETQLDNVETLFHTEVDVLLKDREVVAQERSTEAARAQRHISCLINSLTKAQEKSEIAVRRLLEEHDTSVRDIEVLKSEKELLEKQIMLQEFDKTAAYSAAPTTSSGGKVKLLQERVEHQGRLANTYRKHCKELQAELDEWKERACQTENTLNQKITQLTRDLTNIRSRYEDLDRRRLLEAEGFRTDVKFMKERIDNVNKCILKIKSEGTKKVEDGSDEEDVKQTAQNTLYTAKMFGREVLALKKRFDQISAKLAG